MTDAELRAFIADARDVVDTHLAELDRLDWDATPPDDRAQLEALREGYRDLRATLTDESIAAEVEAATLAGRDLTPAEVAGLLKRQ